MSRKNHIHLADAFIYGYSNFTFIPPSGTTTTAVRSEVANAPMAFEKVNRFTKILLLYSQDRSNMRGM